MSPTAPTIAPDHEVERERDTSGPRIRCPLCGCSELFNELDCGFNMYFE
jgi:hypothetical protein